MTIERVEPIDPIAKHSKKEKLAKVTTKEPVDSVALSKEARRTADIQKIAEVVKQSPAIRMDRVEEIKAKLQDPNYINDVLVSKVADRLMEVFDI